MTKNKTAGIPVVMGSAAPKLDEPECLFAPPPTPAITQDELERGYTARGARIYQRLHPVKSSTGPDTQELPIEKSSNLWVLIYCRAAETDPMLAEDLLQLCDWGCGLKWSRDGRLSLDWPAALQQTPAAKLSFAARSDVLRPIGREVMDRVPVDLVDQFITLWTRYLVPNRDRLLALFRKIEAEWPEEARW